MSNKDGNVAFKCTFNDGGSDGGYVGFDGTCSDQNIIRNVRQGRSWCSNPRSMCRQYHDDHLRGTRPRLPCYESEVFTTWSFGSGFYQSGSRAGEIIPMNGVIAGKVAVLTTRLPDRDHEQERVVFGLFKIAAVERDGDRGIVAIADRSWSIRLSRGAALPYWRFKRGTPDWRMGLFRFMSDQEVADCLHAVAPLLLSPRDRTVMEHLLRCVGGLGRSPSLRVLEQPEVVAGDMLRKYGPGGEGERHRWLKNHVCKNPEILGMGEAISAETEVRFLTGDRVDVAVGLRAGFHCAVEVEVEGETPTLIGAHQVLKYRALLGGATGRVVRGALVAHEIPEPVKRFCNDHDIAAIVVPRPRPVVVRSPRRGRPTSL